VPARYRRSYPARGRSSRRTKVWAELTGQTVTLASAAFSNLDMLSQLQTAGLSTLGVTVLRTVVQIQVTNWAGATDDIIWGTLVGRSTDVGTAAPASALAANGLFDWNYRGFLQPDTMGATIDATKIYNYDYKSRRKVPEANSRYLICLLNQSAASKTLELFTRTLVALP
jgi:hypothetical protein